MRFHPPYAFPLAAVLALTTAAIAIADESPHTYEVGPGQDHQQIGDVPWEALEPGDTVRIHWREQAYREKFVIGRRGTEAAPIVVQGVPGPEGQRPVIDGRDATTRAQLNYWNEDRGVIKIGGANRPADTTPAHIVLEGLEVRSGREPYSFTGRSGQTRYRRNAASVFLEKGEHIVLRDLVLRDSGNGLFIASASRDVLVQGCEIYDNGVEDSIYQHNAYTQAHGLVYQHNRFGPLREGCLGNNLKDRSAGLVVRYNWIEGGNRQLDLVDGRALADQPPYRTTYVYGNVLVDRDGNRQIAHYGGDSDNTDAYRKGTLFFYNNTVVSRRPGRTTLVRLSTPDERADIRNNIIYADAGGQMLEIVATAGQTQMHRNWISDGWQPAFDFSRFAGTVEGEETTRSGGAPGFIDPAADDFRLASGSPCLDAAGPLHDDVPAEHRPTRQWRGIGQWLERNDAGQRHIGAFAPP